MQNIEAPRLYAETEDGTTVFLKLSRNRNYRERFCTMFENAMSTLSQFDRPPIYFRVMCHLLVRLDPIHDRRISAAEIVKAIKSSQSSVERALAMLEADRVIFCYGKTGAKSRRLNNNLVWKSTAEKHNETEDDLPIIDARGRK